MQLSVRIRCGEVHPRGALAACGADPTGVRSGGNQVDGMRLAHLGEERELAGVGGAVLVGDCGWGRLGRCPSTLLMRPLDCSSLRMRQSVASRRARMGLRLSQAWAPSLTQEVRQNNFISQTRQKTAIQRK